MEMSEVSDVQLEASCTLHRLISGKPHNKPTDEVERANEGNSDVNLPPILENECYLMRVKQ